MDCSHSTVNPSDGSLPTRLCKLRRRMYSLCPSTRYTRSGWARPRWVIYPGIVFHRERESGRLHTDLSPNAGMAPRCRQSSPSCLFSPPQSARRSSGPASEVLPAKMGLDRPAEQVHFMHRLLRAVAEEGPLLLLREIARFFSFLPPLAVRTEKLGAFFLKPSAAAASAWQG